MLKPDIMYRESLNWRSPLGPSPQTLRNSMEEGKERLSEGRTPGERGLLNQLSRAHMGSQRHNVHGSVSDPPQMLDLGGRKTHL